MSDEFGKLWLSELTRRDLVKKASLGAGGMMMASLIAACGGSSSTTTTAAGGGGTATTAGGVTPTSAATPSETIKIGFVSPQTGPASAFGEVDPYIIELATAAWAKTPLTVGGKTYAVQIVAKDGQGNPQRGAEVAQELINSDKIDLMLTASTPETINPVADACEAAGVPCVGTTCPWEAFYFGRGAKPGEPSPFKYSYIFSFGTQEFINAFISAWPQIDTNKKVAAMWPNDADGNAIRASIGPALTKAGYTIIDPGAYQDGTNDYSSQIAKFKSENCQIYQGFPLPPDFATFWRQAAQQGFKPLICQPQKAGSNEAEIEALGPIGVNISQGLYWSPAWPYEWKLTGMAAKEIGDSYTAKTGRWPHPQLGASAALFDVAAAVLTASGDPKNKDAVATAFKTLAVDTPIGALKWGAGPVANVVATPILNGQWVKSTGKFPLEWVLTENSNDKNVTVQAKLQPIA